MTTALIGIPGATAAKAVVAVVAQDLGNELADLLDRSGHDHETFPSWEAYRAACADGRVWDLVLYDVASASGLPAELGCPAFGIGDSEDVRDGMPIATLARSMDHLAALCTELRAQSRRRAELESLVEGLRNGQVLAGNCPSMRRVQSGISRAADSEATVLIEGAAGTGKSLAARMIHVKSRRASQPIHILDCADVDADAMTASLGAARGSTLLLEAVDLLPTAAQSVLVKHLKERSGPRSQGAARIVATTSAHLPEAIARGAFREDLYYRLNAFPLVMPALRERLDDIREIAETVLLLASAQSGRPTNGMTPAALVLLESMQWPGNVTQLEAVVRRAHALAGGAKIDREHVAASNPTPVVAPGTHAASPLQTERDLDRDIGEEEIRPFEEEEQYLLSRALRATRGNVRRAAQLLGIGRATLYRKIQQYKLRLQ
ncbi:MAG: sigma-54-dependent Fis family transcriptional regulator [Planctomycetes bacterium]|nr:sigma-54-dependent Fis family transcriptional regulator [Planctomycetota bacterium]